MDTVADLSADYVDKHPERAQSPFADRKGDVPGISCGHSCEMYANEELERRHQRTELMIARAIDQS